MSLDERHHPISDEPPSSSVFGSPALTQTQRAERIAADQYQNWKNGNRIPAEDYLKLEPDLDAEAACDLIYGEFLIREELGESPLLDEYLSRFPDHADGLRKLHAFERLNDVMMLLADDGDDSAESTPEPFDGDTEMESDPAILDDEFGSLPRVALEATNGDPTERMPRTLGAARRYQLLGEIGRGAMGAVIRGHDSNLGRDVAIKILLDGQRDRREIVRRFLKEAQITGQLEHPNIVPVHELARRDEDDQPFYTMRLVHGQTLRDAIVELHQNGGLSNRLELQKLLAAFINICQAVGYAHSRGVVHRDLKPANVVMGGFGEVIVLDWGLAKMIGKSDQVDPADAAPGISISADAETAGTLGKVGTPAYMAPEQVEFRHDLIDGRTDVYALGGILFEILTGKPSVEGSTRKEVFDKILAGSIPRARDLAPTISRALDAICSRAMARDREGRYARATDLAEDVRRWIADEPVSAYPEPFAEKARRWAKRNRTAVTAAVASLLVGLVGLGAVTAVLISSNIALDAQRRRAEDREALAIDAVKQYRDAVANEPELKNTPALEDLRKRLLKKSLDFFRDLRDRLQADRDTTPKSLDRLAQASHELGYLANEIGNKQDALIAYRESLAVIRKLAEANPSNTKFQSDLALSYNNLGLVLSLTGQPDEALKAYKSALAIWQRLADANPSDTQLQSHLATSHHNIGIVLSETGRLAEAMQAHKLALAIRRRLADANPTVTQFQSELAASQHDIGLLLSETGQPVEAMKVHESELAILQKLADANPTVAQFQSDLAVCHISIGILWNASNQTAEALKSQRAALAISQKLADANPSVTRFQSDLATSHSNIGAMLQNAGRAAEALESYGLALAIRRKLADANPTVTRFQSDLATSHQNIGLLLSDTGKPAEALKSYGLALAIRQRLADANPSVTQFQRDLALSHYRIGLLLRVTHQPAKALEAYKSALAIYRKLADANPTDTRFQSDLADCDLDFGVLLTETGKLAEALEVYKSALAIYRKLARDHPESPDYASNLASTLNNLAANDLLVKRYEEARVRLQEAIEWLRKALASDPANPSYRRSIANNYTNLIMAYRGLGDTEGVARAERELAELRDSDPTILGLNGRLFTFLPGNPQPGGNREWRQLAQRAYDKADYAASAKLWADAFDADPKLAEDRQAQHRYNAACAAALAGCGQGKDVPPLDDRAKARLREQARGWLQAELTAWTKRLESDPPQAWPSIVQTLKHWRGDGDLAGIREAKALEALPESERDAWRALWAGVDTLLARADTASAQTSQK